jgi:response regulator of citrate/malate metabolism
MAESEGFVDIDEEIDLQEFPIFKDAYQNQRKNSQYFRSTIMNEVAIKSRKSNRNVQLIMRDNYMDDEEGLEPTTPQPE